MPGSPKSSGKGSGKKKLTKAEREKMKREEEERLAIEAEEARLSALEDERVEKIREKEQAEEMKKQNNEERKLRKILMEELDVVLGKHRNFLSERKLSKYTNDKWARYMRCDGSPDPANLGEINTYINLKSEDRTKEDIDIVLQYTQQDLSLIEELEYLMKFSPEDSMNDALIDQYNETIYDLQTLIKMKLDMASHNLLLAASHMQHPETSNLQYHKQDANLTLSLWGNLAKNPRTKAFEFPEINFGFDIPKLLTQTYCSYRVLWCKFDHYSQYCKTYQPRIKIIKDEPVEELKEEDEQGEEDGEKVEGQDEAKGEEQQEDNTMDVLAELRILETDEELTKVEEPVEEEEVIDDWPDPPTPEPVEWEDFEEYDDVIDLRSFGTVGGVFHFNLLHLPPQPKHVKSWILTQLVTPPAIQYIDYVSENATPTPKEGSEREVLKKDERPPINMSVKLPPNVMIFEEPTVTRWDEKHKYWSTAGFDDIKYDEALRIIKCTTTHFGTMAFLQDLHINMPFQSWELRPRGPNHCRINIIAAIIEMEIDIKDDLCCLIQPEQKPECEHLIKNWMKPRDLITELQRCGINIFPNVDSSKYVSTQKKHPLVEDKIYLEMALTSCCMAYAWSKWNSDTGEDKFVFQGVECLIDEAPIEEDWSLYMFTKKKVQRLKMKEYDDMDFSEEKHPDHKFTCDLYHLVQDIGTDAAKELLNNADIKYTESVRHILSAIKFLTYS